MSRRHQEGAEDADERGGGAVHHAGANQVIRTRVASRAPKRGIRWHAESARDARNFNSARRGMRGTAPDSAAEYRGITRILPRIRPASKPFSRRVRITWLLVALGTVLSPLQPRVYNAAAR